MATEEEWRQIGYQRWVGQTGNNSMGTTYNQQGYETYQAGQTANTQSWQHTHSPPLCGTNTYQSGHSGRTWDPTQGMPSTAGSHGGAHTGTRHTKLSRQEKRLLGAIALLITAGAVAGFIYGQFFVTSQYPSWVFATGGAIAGGAIIPAIVFAIELLATLVEAVIETVQEFLVIAFRLIVIAVLGTIVYQLYHYFT